MKLNEERLKNIIEKSIVKTINEAAGDNKKLEQIKNVFRRKYKQLGWPEEKIEAQIEKDFPTVGPENDVKLVKPQPQPLKSKDVYAPLDGGSRDFLNFDNADDSPINIGGKTYYAVYEAVEKVVGRILRENAERLR